MKETKFKQTEIGEKELPHGFEIANAISLRDENGKSLDFPNPHGNMEDWKTVCIGDVCKIGHGKDYKNLKEGDVPVYGTGGYMCSVNQYLHDGETVCIGRKGTIDKPFYYNGKIWTVDTLFYTYDFNGIVPKFLYYKFCLVDWLSMNEASGVPSLTSKNIEDVIISVPSKPEQSAIAKVLSDIDNVISTLEKLIQKKKNIKQGAMQELLTGKKRLPDFAKSTAYKHTELGEIPEDWEVKKLVDLAITSSGGTPSRENLSFYKGNIKWFTTTELKDCRLYESEEHISNLALESSSAKIFPAGTLLMAMYGATIGRLGILECEAATNQACCAIMTKDIDSLYLYYNLLHSRDYIVSLGSGAGQPNISQEIVKNLNISFPPTLAEQQRIAKVLSDMDKEIDSLNKKLQKYRQLKTAMMQQLLTGKIRLVK